MKTLRSIVNRTHNDSLKVLQSFVNKYAKNKYEVTKEHLYWLFLEASKQFNNYEPYKVSQDFKLYEIPYNKKLLHILNNRYNIIKLMEK